MVFDNDRVREIAGRVAASNGLEIFDIEFHGSGNNRMLRIFIDKPAGVTHQDCADFSREFGTIADVEDAVPGGSYVLEVSSPGLDRKLRPSDYPRFIGSLVKLKTYQPVNGSQSFKGRLESASERRIVLALEAKPVKTPKKKEVVEAQKIELELSNIEVANLVPEF